MVIFNVVKWEMINIVFVINTFVFVSGKAVYHNDKSEDASENSSDLYFNGREEENANDPLSKITEKDLPKDGELFEGDMIMDSELRRAILGVENKKAAVFDSELDGRKHWEDGVVPFVIDDSLHDELREQIPKAIKILNYFTCVRFVPRTNQADYVIIMDGKGCSSSVGRRGGPQNIHLARGCKRIGTVLHEMMHALGIIHEQSRPDRDLFLEVRTKNIKDNLLRNFMKYPFNRADTLDIPYNYYSVMHYSNHAFSKNDEDTLVSKFDPTLKFGQRKMLTHLDVKQINTLYRCNKRKRVRDDLLHDDMTPNIILKRRRDARNDELRAIIDKYF